MNMCGEAIALEKKILKIVHPFAVLAQNCLSKLDWTALAVHNMLTTVFILNVFI